jgi:hypothetical protein
MPPASGKHIAIPVPPAKGGLSQSPSLRAGLASWSVRLGDLAFGHAGLAADAWIDGMFTA